MIECQKVRQCVFYLMIAALSFKLMAYTDNEECAVRRACQRAGGVLRADRVCLLSVR